MINRHELSNRINEIIAADPGFVDRLLLHVTRMMQPSIQSALANASAWIFHEEHGDRALVISLQSDALTTKHRHYLHVLCERVRVNSGIIHVRLMQAERPLAVLRYSPSMGRWFHDFQLDTVNA
jgi:hypothetical protein